MKLRITIFISSIIIGLLTISNAQKKKGAAKSYYRKNQSCR